MKLIKSAHILQCNLNLNKFEWQYKSLIITKINKSTTINFPQRRIEKKSDDTRNVDLINTNGYINDTKQILDFVQHIFKLTEIITLKFFIIFKNWKRLHLD